jgi:apolipoprotein N-acyltransferase
MNKYTLVALSVTGGILSGLAWSSWCSGLILLIAFVPFFLIENILFKNGEKYADNAVFLITLPGFVLFNILAIGWVRIATITGAICIIMGLSSLMAIAIWLGHLIRCRAGNFTGFVSLVSLWLTFEFLTLNNDLISPWLNLGNGLSKDIMFIQWYDVTGVSGGSLWILCSNLILSFFLESSLAGKKNSRTCLLIWLSIIVIPSVISITRYYSVQPDNVYGKEVVIIQPNVDPYTEKFTIPFEVQWEKAMTMAKSAVTKKTSWIITPETTVDDPVNEDDADKNNYIMEARKLVFEHPGICIMTGMVSYKLYPASGEAPTNSARKIDASGIYYDHFNSAFKIDTGNNIGIYHKSKLIPGIELQFTTGPGKLLSRILPSYGGTEWGYGVQRERKCFIHPADSVKIAPVICYESVYGDYLAEYVRNGAEAIFIITNDGWWKNTSGYKQHLSYASVRAIETRRPVARAANTGISCLIDIKGKRVKESAWWTRAIITGEIFPETRLTTYVKYGDYLLHIALVISSIILILVFVATPVRKKIRQDSGNACNP